MPLTNFNKKEKIYFLITIPFNLLFSGIVATILGYEALYDLVNVFIFLQLSSLILCDMITGLEHKHNLKQPSIHDDI